MLTSSRRGITYPNTNRTDSADVPRDFAAMVAALEVDVLYGQGTLAARPTSSGGSPGIAGRLYMATDQTPHALYWDFGTGWDGPFAIGTISIPDGSITGGPAGAGVKIAALTITHDNIVAGTIRGGGNELAAGSITAADIAAALKPSGGAGGGTEALRALGTAAGTAAAGTHASQHHPQTGADRITMSLAGTAAARPAASAVVVGTLWFSTDTLVLQRSDGSTTWTTVGSPGGPTVTYATTPPGSPNTGDIWYYVDSTTNPTVQWQFRYNGSSTSAYKWEFVGGTDLYVTNAGGNAPPAATYTQVSGLTVTLPRAGDYNLEYGFRAQPGNDNDALMAPDGAGITAADAIAAWAGMAGGGTTGIKVTPVWCADFFACTAALITFYLKRSSSTGATVTNPWVRVRPKRVS